MGDLFGIFPEKHLGAGELVNDGLHIRVEDRERRPMLRVLPVIRRVGRGCDPANLLGALIKWLQMLTTKRPPAVRHPFPFLKIDPVERPYSYPNPILANGNIPPGP